MKFFGVFILVAALFTIVVEGTYNEREIVEISLQLVPMPYAQPGLVERSLSDYNGIQDVRLDVGSSRLHVRYDKAQISFADLEHLLTSLGFRAMQLSVVQAGV